MSKKETNILRAGTGRVDVSPRDQTFLIGYPHVERLSTGIHDPLYATALCLDDGENQTISVAVDVLYVHSKLVDQCRRRIEERLRIRPEHIMISATHTHSGSTTCSILAMTGVQVIYHNGPCGNLSPRYHVKGQTFAEAERLGLLSHIDRRHTPLTNLFYRARAFIALTARTPQFRWDDVADRLLILRVERIRQFRPERELLEETRIRPPAKVPA